MEQMRQETLNHSLVAMSIASGEFEDGQEYDELVLEFSNKEPGPEKFDLSVSFDVAIGLEHPAICQYKSRSRANRGSKRKRRSRKKHRKK
jgi:hypothetical protein